MNRLPTIYSETYKNNRFCPEANDEAYEGVYYVLSKNKKDVKPLLLLSVAETFGAKAEACLPAAYAMELFNYSGIVLKDVTDQYSPWSNKPSDFSMLTPSGSIITGDQLIILAYKYLAMIETDQLRKIMGIFNNTIIDFVKGQQMSLSFSQGEPISYEEYIDIVSLQSPGLTSLSMRIGALLGAASEADQELISRAGRQLGLSLQFKEERDRVFEKKELNLTESPFVYYKAMDLADSEQKKILRSAFDNKESNLREMAELSEKLNLEKITLEVAGEYYDHAAASLEKLSADKQKINRLVESIKSLSTESD